MRSRRWRWRWMAAATMLAAAGCSQGEPADEGGVLAPPLPVDGEVVRSAVSPPPIIGGTLLAIEDGTAVVASDPDRDLVHVVDLAHAEVRHTVPLPAGDEPGRLAVDAEGLVHVVARRSGVVVDLDPAQGVVTGRRTVCPNPRGIAYDPELDAVHVACAGGELVSLPAADGAPIRRVHVATDLRDVIMTDEGLLVSRLRTAELLRLDDQGAVVERLGLPVLERQHAVNFQLVEDAMAPNTAWRTVATPDGDWLMLHQASTTRALGLPTGDDEDSDGASGDVDGGGDEGYGGSGVDPHQCAAAVHPVVTLGHGALDTQHSGLLAQTVLPVDVAVSSQGVVAMAVAGVRTLVSAAGRGGVVWTPLSDFSPSTEADCTLPREIHGGDGQFVAVTFDWTGRVVAQSREPARITCIDPQGGQRPTIVELPGEPRRDTGHDLFHLDAGGGISCATCHPEGGDDGHVWRLQDVGMRHTPALTVGLSGTEPFHWEGDLADMTHLVEEVHQGRMGGSPLSAAHVDALQSWLFSVPIPAPVRSPEDAAVARGAALFSAWGCGSCHAGPAMAGNDNVDLGLGVMLQVPGLHGVALHPPYMHDGRAADLPAAVRDMMARTRPQSPSPSEAEVSDVVAFLESL